LGHQLVEKLEAIEAAEQGKGFFPITRVDENVHSFMNRRLNQLLIESVELLKEEAPKKRMEI
jgi:hypothetical protein